MSTEIVKFSYSTACHLIAQKCSGHGHVIVQFRWKSFMGMRWHTAAEMAATMPSFNCFLKAIKWTIKGHRDTIEINQLT